MTDHLRRIRDHVALETQALLLEAQRARLFDHNTNRGSEAEHSILRWLRARFAPGYGVSSGEIIDSFDTNSELPSRQQDGILHRHDPEANRFVFPSGLRLVPVETVAAVIEVKLTLSKEEFEKADRAATETARLRVRGRANSIAYLRHEATVVPSRLSEDQISNGVPLSDFVESAPPTFAVFSFAGIKEIETIADWLREARTINLVCCLEAGCVLRGHPTQTGFRLYTVSQREHALVRFGECIGAAISNHKVIWISFHPDFQRYSTDQTLTYWDETRSYEHPGWYTPHPEELAAREQLYIARPSLRPR